MHPHLSRVVNHVGIQMIDPLPRRIAWFAPWTWKHRWWIVAAILLVGYPLSYGPACVLAVDGLIPSAAVSLFYRPLFWAIRYIPFVGEVMHSYVGFVLKLTGRDRNFG